MKNQKTTMVITTLAAIICSTVVHAGGMGAVSALSGSTPFISLEGSYTWNKIDATRINNHVSGINRQPWGGRLAAGIVRPYSEKFSFSTEFGGGYYGSTSRKSIENGAKNKHAIDGYDLLVGGLYKINQFGLFGSVGAMVQNVRTSGEVDLSQQIPGGVFSGVRSFSFSNTEMLPEIKIGGVYSLGDNLDLSLAYMHVFGSEMTANMTAAGGVFSGSSSNQNPTLDSLMLGARYYFV